MPTVKQLRVMATTLGLKSFNKLRKTDLIHEIQIAEGHDPCFGTIPGCGQEDCLFREDCLSEMAQAS